MHTLRPQNPSAICCSVLKQTEAPQVVTYRLQDVCHGSRIKQVHIYNAD